MVYLNYLIIIVLDFPNRMIPKKIHYCWFGGGEMPELAKKCMDSWHRFMPDYEYYLWNEDNFDINSNQYAKEAYDSGKSAFVSDVVRLKALNEFGGIYFDVDFIVYKPFDDLLSYSAFAGFEGSRYNPVMMGVIASEAQGEWVREQLRRYEDRHFIVNGKMDLTTNVKFITDYMQNRGFKQNGQEQDYKDLHVFPVDYFCPRLTTGEYLFSERTYCEHLGQDSSWATKSLKGKILDRFSPKFRTFLIHLKRRLVR